MSVRTPAIVAGALFASLIGTASAQAATARIAPVTHTASAYETSIVLGAHRADSCRMLVDVAVIDIAPVWRVPRAPLTACQRVFEDGTAVGYATLRIPPAVVRPGRTYWVSVRVWSHARAAGSRWSSHTFLRSFTPRLSDSLPTVRLADCRLGPC